MHEMTNKQQGEILNMLFKEQFRLKLGVVYLVSSGFNILLILVCYILSKAYTLDKVITIYLISMLLYYKFASRWTKDGGFYRVFLLKAISDFKARTEKKLRDILKNDSAKKLNTKDVK